MTFSSAQEGNRKRAKDITIFKIRYRHSLTEEDSYHLSPNHHFPNKEHKEFDYTLNLLAILND